MNEKLTAKELAGKLKISRWVIYKWASENLIPRVPGLGARLLRFDPAEIDDWLRAGGIEEARSRKRKSG